MLDFCGSQRAAYKRHFKAPPVDFDWRRWSWVGGEVVIASPTVSRLMYRRALDAHENCTERLQKVSGTSSLPKMPPSSDSARICLIHRSDNLADLAPQGNIYQAALTCNATANDKTEAMVIEDIRNSRRLSTPPESSRLQYETTTGTYYDPETQLYYNPKTGYFFDPHKSSYFYWSATEKRYIAADQMVKAQAAAMQIAQKEAAHAAALQAWQEREAAKTAGAVVAAQLTALRAEKDEYAGYAFATCFLSQQSSRASTTASTPSMSPPVDHLQSFPKRPTAANKVSKCSDDDLYPPGCPPPPGT